MGKKHIHHLPIFSTRATATLSVALVLVILGLSALVGLATCRVTDMVRENMGFVIILDDDVTGSDIEQVTERLKTLGGVGGCTYSSPEMILERWQHLLGDEENIEYLAGVNPFAAELEVRMDAMHADRDSIAAIAGAVELMPQVSEVRVHNELVDKVNSTLTSVSVTLLILAMALLTVSFVLIFNTVRLSVYSRRFLINTMQLVGATAAFVRRPFLKENLVNGCVAGGIASVALGVLTYYCRNLDPSVAEAVRWSDVAMVMSGMVMTGAFICVVAAWFATNRYLQLSYDDLYK